MKENLTPKKIVEELDRYIIGQEKAKKMVAIALRNRWRRQQLDAEIAKEITPKNILMIGPTGCGKTEIARRLAKLVEAPFIKVEATRYTEIGYVGHDVEGIIRDLAEIAIQQFRERLRIENVEKASVNAEARIIQAITGSKDVSAPTFEEIQTKLRHGEFDEKEIEIELEEAVSPLSMPTMEVPGMPGAQMGMLNIADILGKAVGAPKKTKVMNVKEAYKRAQEEEADKLIDEEKLIRSAIEHMEQNAIVFIDEFDKICKSSEQGSRGDVSREGVQRDLLPLIEGTHVNTKYGVIDTSHILFIASGAFHLAKPSDLLPELQGRLPIRVALEPLTYEDFVSILTSTRHSLPDQYVALLKTENVTISFGEETLQRLAFLATELNSQIENIGARRLHTVMEKLLEELSFHAPDMANATVVITPEMVNEQLQHMIEDRDLSRYIL